MFLFKSVFVTSRNWASSIHCTERSCNWLCRPSAQRKRTTRESWTTTGWWVSSMLVTHCWTSRPWFVLYTFVLYLSAQGGWMILACLSIKRSLMRPGLTAACCTTWQWWVSRSPKALRISRTDEFDQLHTDVLKLECHKLSIGSTFPFRMISFLWKWEVSCITWASRELSKSSD